MKPSLKVAFGSAVTRYNDIIFDALSENYQLEINENKTDLLFVSDTQAPDPRSKTVKTILVSIENSYPNFNIHDGALNYLDTKHPRILRLPYYTLIVRPDEIVKSPSFAEKCINESRKFCAFVVSNKNAFRTRERVAFFKALNSRKQVDSGGAFMNNIGGRVGDLQKFYRNYRFCITFENLSFPGYTTEKIVCAMREGCIPIYWGNPKITEEFNPKSFINVRAYKSFNAVIEHVIEIYNNPQLMYDYLSAPYFYHNSPSVWYEKERVEKFLNEIIERPRPLRKFPYVNHRYHRAKLKMLPYLKLFLDNRKHYCSLSV